MSDTASPMGRLIQPRVLLLLALLVLSAFSTAVSSEDSQVRLEMQINDASAKDWYQQGETIEIAASIINDGAFQSIENDPSCNVIFQVLNTNNEVILNGEDSCRGQSQNIDLDNGELLQFEEMSWDLKDSTGIYVPSGQYTIKTLHPTTNLFDEVQVEIQTSIETPQQLELVLTVSNRQQPILDNQNIILSVSLYNPSKELITLPAESECKLISNIGDTASLQLPCFPEINTITSGQQILLGTILIPAVQTITGDLNIEVFNVGKTLTQSVNVVVSQSDITDIEERTDGLRSDMHVMDNDLLYSEGELLQSSLLLTNVGDSERTLTLTVAEWYLIQE